MNTPALDRSVAFIDSWLQFGYERSDVPGYSVAIAHKGKIVFSKAYGYADLENKVQMTPQHIFRIASHSKTFTATAVMQLAEQKKVNIEEPAATYLPWLKEHKDSRFQKVTVRQLLSHGAGVIRDGLDADYWQLERPFPDTEEFKKEILEAELVIDNNVQLKYSNYGYTLLGCIVEAVSGASYNAYVSENIVKKLSLENTGPEYIPAIKGQLVTGYTRQNTKKERLPIANIDTHAMSAATGFYSTAEDLCTYFAAQMVGSKKLLSDETKKEMQREQWRAKRFGGDNEEAYGLGINIDILDTRRTIGHGGGFPGQVTKSMADPKSELVVVVLCNSLDSWPSSIAKGIYSIIDYYQENTAKSKPSLLKLEGRYSNLWGTTEIVVTGDRIAAIYPGALQPFNEVEKLERISDTSFKVAETSSFNSEGELVQFTLKKGAVESLNYCGMTMWPETVWEAQQQERTIIGDKV